MTGLLFLLTLMLSTRSPAGLCCFVRVDV